MPETEHSVATTITEHFEHLADLRGKVEDAKLRYESSREYTNSLKKSWESQRDAFEQAFDDVARRLHGADLAPVPPLIAVAEQSAAVDTLVAQLAAVDYAIDPIVVAAFTPEERAQVETWALAEAATRRAQAQGQPGGPVPPRPAILDRDESEDVTPADLHALLSLVAGDVETGFAGDEIPSLETLAGWTRGDRLAAQAWAQAMLIATQAGADARSAGLAPDVDLPERPAILGGAPSTVVAFPSGASMRAGQGDSDTGSTGGVAGGPADVPVEAEA